jgi:hypothetical protein
VELPPEPHGRLKKFAPFGDTRHRIEKLKGALNGIGVSPHWAEAVK